ncbi:MAG: hypothetical protein GX347_02570 [Epulopiscium sp.]|nr:hypothetical protein [Candidatus Epulonipiscium sp.]
MQKYMIKKDKFTNVQWFNCKDELYQKSQLYLICILITFFVVFLLGFLTNLFANQSVAAHPFTENIQSEEELVIERKSLNYNDREIQNKVSSIEPEADIELTEKNHIENHTEIKDITEIPEVEEQTVKEETKIAKVEETVSKTDPIEKLTDQDLEALYRIVEAEATQEDMIGRILIANVVFNRVRSDGFPNTVYDVIHQKINGRAQFSPIDDQRYFTVTVSEKTKEAVQRALAGEDYSKGALFFVARSMASSNAVSWFDQNLTKVYVHGVHEFFSY